MKKILFLLVMLFAFSPTILASDHFVSKADNEIVSEESHNASAAMAGETVKLNGSITGIAFGAGNKVELNGQADYAALAGNNVTVSGTIINDAFIAGNLITTKPEAVFQRDAIIAATDIELSGNFERNASLYSGKVTLKDVKVKGNVKVYAENLTIEKGTVIEGTLYYPEDCNYKVSDDVTINAIEKTKAINNHDEENYFATVSAKIWSYLSLAFVFAAICLFIPNAFNRINEKYEKFELLEGVEVFTKGLVILILVPVIAIMLFFTILGIPLGIILFLLYGIAIYIAKIFTAYLIGYKIWQKVFNKDAHILLFGLLGLVILLILELIPGLRTLASILALLIGLGLIFDALKKVK